MTDPPEYFDAHTKMCEQKCKNKTMLADFALKKQHSHKGNKDI